jgi:carbamoyl-phosphate synthase large subunit
MQSKLVSKRLLSASASTQAQAAPDTKAYLENLPNILVKAKKLDVKKALVIGSGGLAIGQAGEFDYSGT